MNIIIIVIIFVVAAVLFYMYYKKKSKETKNVVPKSYPKLHPKSHPKSYNEFHLESNPEFHPESNSETDINMSLSLSSSRFKKVNPDSKSVFDNFGLPLISKEENELYTKKIHDSHKQYQKSFGDFTKYQTDHSAIIENDLMKPELTKSYLKGKTAQEVYDEQVAGPKVKKKKVVKQDTHSTIYEGNNPMASAYDINCFKTAEFSDEFDLKY